MKISTLTVALCCLCACSKKSETSGQPQQPESTAYASGYNFYRTASENEFAAFKSIILSWGLKNGYKTEEHLPLKISKTYAPKCVAAIWIEEESPGLFKLIYSRQLEGDRITVDKATADNNAEGASLFDAVETYYVLPEATN